MIIIQGIYTTDIEGQICLEPERQLTPEEQSIIKQISVYEDIFHYTTIYD